METIRVVIVDEQPLFHAGIRVALECLGGCRDVGEAIETSDVLMLARTYSPDVALLDASLSGADPLELAHQLLHDVPHMAVVLLTAQISHEPPGLKPQRLVPAVMHRSASIQIDYRAKQVAA